MNKPRIRPIDASHIGTIIDIAERTNLSHWSAQSYIDELKDTRSIMFRLESTENATIGFLVGRVVLATDNEKKVDAEIYNIAVIREKQGSGFGQILMDEFLERCHVLNVRSIWLEVRESNESALRFYERNGFSLVSTRKFFYSNPRENGLLMRLTI